MDVKGPPKPEDIIGGARLLAGAKRHTETEHPMDTRSGKLDQYTANAPL